MEGQVKTVVMVDDDITSLRIAYKMLCRQYSVHTAPSGLGLFLLLERITPDLVLLDVEMPEMNGFEAIRRMKVNPSWADIPVIFLTGRSDAESELEGLSLGAVDYVTKPFSAAILQKRVENHLLLQEYARGLEGAVEERTRTINELQAAMLSTVAEIVEYRDDITGGHVERTQRYLAVLMAEMLRRGLYREETENWDYGYLFQSAALHDVGKVAVRDNILLKPGRLTPEEFEIMKRHAEMGSQIIERIEKATTQHDFLHHAKVFAQSHHEWWNGEGYPLGLQGQEIPLQGRLLAVVDVYDVLVSERPYKESMSHAEAVDVIIAESGEHFDPVLVELFLAKAEDFERISKSCEDRR